MARYKILPLVLILASGFSKVIAQNATSSGQLKVREIPPTPERKERVLRPLPPLGEHAPFSLNGDSSQVVDVLPESALSEQDKMIEENAESTIRERAALQALDLSSGQWSYSELACKSFPRHLFLRFNRNNGAGDESAFTVSIPRDGNGRIRFIPLLRRGYSLWSPTPVNAITVGSFNHILAEERSDADPDSRPEWASMAVCYAALAGSGGPDAESVELSRPPMLHISFSGESSVDFITGNHRLFHWEMVFDRKGILKKATRRAMRSEEARVLKPTVIGDGTALPATGDSSGQTLPATNPQNGSTPPQQ